MKQLALRIEVNTLRGTREGVPHLLDALARHGAKATFLFTLGADRSGRNVLRLPRVKGLSRSRLYGFSTLLYGRFLPAPDIGRKCADTLRGVRDAGHEVGVQSADRHTWLRQGALHNPAGTETAFQRAIQGFEQLFGEPPRVMGAPGWQINRHALRLEQRKGLHYCSDTRGTAPYLPVWQAELVTCPQLPTTLPTLDELIGHDSITLANVVDHLLDLTRESTTGGHVFTLRAEIEGGILLPQFDQLLDGWKQQGYILSSLGDYFAALDSNGLPHHEVVNQPFVTHRQALATQGQKFFV